VVWVGGRGRCGGKEGGGRVEEGAGEKGRRGEDRWTGGSPLVGKKPRKEI